MFFKLQVLCKSEKCICENDIKEQVIKTIGDEEDVSISDDLMALVNKGAILKHDETPPNSIDMSDCSHHLLQPTSAPITTYSPNEQYHLDFDGIPVICCGVHGNIFLRQFNSVHDASSELDISIASILHVCRGLAKDVFNLTFRWCEKDWSDSLVNENAVSVDYIKSLKLDKGKPRTSKAFRRSKMRRLDGDHNILRRPAFPESLADFIGRRFKKTNGDDNSEVFYIRHVCSSQETPGVFFYRYYSLSKHQTRPMDEREYHYSPADEMINPNSWVDWIPVGTHTSSTLLLPHGGQSRKHSWHGSKSSGGHRRGAFSDEDRGSVSSADSSHISDIKEGDSLTNRIAKRRGRVKEAESKLLDLLKVR